MKKLLGLVLSLLITSNVYAAVEWSVTDPLGTRNVSDIDYYVGNNNATIDRLLANYRKGMALTYNSVSQIDVASGEIVCSNSDGSVRKFRRNTATTTVTWADIDTGAEASSTTYYVYANCDADATTATFKISANSTTPSGLTSYKKLGSFYNNAASDIALVSDDEVLSQIGAPVSKSDSVVYKASTDGWVVGYTTLSSTNASLTCYSDTTSAPTTVVQYAAGTWVSGSPGVSHPISFPVRKGNYYKVVGSAGSTFNFYPIGN